jgi:hypothetical protein
VSELADTLSDERQKRLDNMLTFYTDVQDTIYNGQLGDGEGVTLMPEVWRKSGYPTLELLLRELRKQKPDDLEMLTLIASGQSLSLYGQVREWYFRCQHVRQPILRQDKRGRQYHLEQHGEKQYRLAVVRHELCRPQLVRRALEWLGAAWPQSARFQPESVAEITKRLERRVAA